MIVELELLKKQNQFFAVSHEPWIVRRTDGKAYPCMYIHINQTYGDVKSFSR
jgi:hypothetical protein